MCDLPRWLDSAYGYVYNISVSNDGKVFSNSVTVISYKGECLDCSLVSCKIKVGIVITQRLYPLN